MRLSQKIKELEKLVGQLIKLTNRAIEFAGELTLLALAVKTIIELF